MEIVTHVNENASYIIFEIRMTLFPTLIEICKAIRNPAKNTKLVAWDDFDGDQEFYAKQGFSPYQIYYLAKRSLNDFIQRSAYQLALMFAIIQCKQERKELLTPRLKTNIIKEYIEASICWNG